MKKLLALLGVCCFTGSAAASVSACHVISETAIDIDQAVIKNDDATITVNFKNATDMNSRADGSGFALSDKTLEIASVKFSDAKDAVVLLKNPAGAKFSISFEGGVSRTVDPIKYPEIKSLDWVDKTSFDKIRISWNAKSGDAKPKSDSFKVSDKDGNVIGYKYVDSVITLLHTDKIKGNDVISISCGANNTKTIIVTVSYSELTAAKFSQGSHTSIQLTMTAGNMEPVKSDFIVTAKDVPLAVKSFDAASTMLVIDYGKNKLPAKDDPIKITYRGKSVTFKMPEVKYTLNNAAFEKEQGKEKMIDLDMVDGNVDPVKADFNLSDDLKAISGFDLKGNVITLSTNGDKQLSGNDVIHIQYNKGKTVDVHVIAIEPVLKTAVFDAKKTNVINVTFEGGNISPVSSEFVVNSAEKGVISSVYNDTDKTLTLNYGDSLPSNGSAISVTYNKGTAQSLKMPQVNPVLQSIAFDQTIANQINLTFASGNVDAAEKDITVKDDKKLIQEYTYSKGVLTLTKVTNDLLPADDPVHVTYDGVTKDANELPIKSQLTDAKFADKSFTDIQLTLTLGNVVPTHDDFKVAVKEGQATAVKSFAYDDKTHTISVTYDGASVPGNEIGISLYGGKTIFVSIPSVNYVLKKGMDFDSPDCNSLKLTFEKGNVKPVKNDFHVTIDKVDVSEGIGFNFEEAYSRATIKLNQSAPLKKGAKVSVTFNGLTDDSLVDDIVPHINKADWVDSNLYQQIKIVTNGGNRPIAKDDITLKDDSRSIDIDFSFDGKDTLTINPLDWQKIVGGDVIKIYPKKWTNEPQNLNVPKIYGKIDQSKTNWTDTHDASNGNILIVWSLKSNMDVESDSFYAFGGTRDAISSKYDPAKNVLSLYGDGFKELSSGDKLTITYASATSGEQKFSITFVIPS